MIYGCGYGYTTTRAAVCVAFASTTYARYGCAVTHLRSYTAFTGCILRWFGYALLLHTRLRTPPPVYRLDYFTHARCALRLHTPHTCGSWTLDFARSSAFGWITGCARLDVTRGYRTLVGYPRTRRFTHHRTHIYTHVVVCRFTTFHLRTVGCYLIGSLTPTTRLHVYTPSHTGWIMVGSGWITVPVARYGYAAVYVRG